MLVLQRRHEATTRGFTLYGTLFWARLTNEMTTIRQWLNYITSRVCKTVAVLKTIAKRREKYEPSFVRQSMTKRHTCRRNGNNRDS